VAAMSLSDIWFLYRARLRARAVLVQEGFAIVGIAIGVALLFASQVASTSLTHSVQQLTDQTVGDTQYQLQARGPEGVDGRLLEEVRRVPGVATALPVLEVQANVIGPTGRQRSVDMLGTTPSFAHFSGPLLRHFSVKRLEKVHAIALPVPLARAVGVSSLERVKLQIGASVVNSLVGATLQEADIGGLVHSPIAIAPIAYVQHLTGVGDRVTQIFIHVAPGRTVQVRAALGRLAAADRVNLEPANFDSTLFAVASAPENQGETLFSVISALVGFMFALNAMLITVPARRRLIEDIRPQGATRLMTVQILMFDAAVLGVLACVIGLALGELLSVAAFHATPGYLASAFPVGDDRVVTWQSVVLAVGAGLVAATVGVLWPLRDILGRSRQTAKDLHNKRTNWAEARLVMGFACLGLTTIIIAFRSREAVLGNFTLVVALVCLLPLLFDVLVSVFDRIQNLANGAASVLAVTELQTPQARVRSLAIAATAAIAVFGIVAIQGAQANLQRGLNASAREIDASTDIWVTPRDESGLLTTIPFRATALSSLSHLPGVENVGIYRGSFLNWDSRRLWVLGPAATTRSLIPSSQLISGNLALAMSRVREGGWAILSQALASEHHLRIGEQFILPAPRPIALRVAALSTNLGWPPGAIVLASRDYARAWESGDASAYEIQSMAGVAGAVVSQEVRQTLGPKTGLVVETAHEREQRHYRLVNQGLSRLTQIRILMLIAAMLAVAGAMGAMIWQRCDLVAFIKRQGYARGVLLRWLLCESALLLGAGCLIGALFGLYGQALISHALAGVTGFPVLFDVGTRVALLSFALIAIVAMAFSSMASFLVVRVSPSTVNSAS
jgi:putative ABC transport system permease protein